MTEEKENFSKMRTEEVQSIIERMPTSFGLWVTVIVAFLFTLMFLFGWLVRYPDVVTGEIIINANLAPLKLVANVSGKLKLNVKSTSYVKEGQIIAYIDNSASLKSVLYIDSLLKLHKPNNSQILQALEKIPQNLSLGELNTKYYMFSNSLQEFSKNKLDKRLEKQLLNLNILLQQQKEYVHSAKKKIDMSNNTLLYIHKFYIRDSTLFMKKIISESELDKTQISYLSAKDGYQNSINEFITAQQGVHQTETKLQDLTIDISDKQKELKIALYSSYNELTDNIKIWEQKYVFRSPFNGRVQFLKFYTENQFIQSGEAIFTVIPEQSSPIGQLLIAAKGAGKIKAGQEVIVKLDNYPYLEYGSITGKVNSISLTTNTSKMEKNEIDTYMVSVYFPSQLITNFGTKLEYKIESKGSGEIITKDRRLIQRLFDNLKYTLHK